MDDDQHRQDDDLHGGAPALPEIYRRYKNELLTVAVCLLGDPGAAEDVLHEVFVALAARGPELRVRGGPRPYLVAAVANRSRDVLRNRARRDRLRPVPRSGDDAAAPDRASSDERELMAALTDLPPDQREVIVLRVHGDLTFAQIADVQGVTVETVKSRRRYALDRLRRQLEGIRS